jgi:quinol monooxygenase YgiN
MITRIIKTQLKADKRDAFITFMNNFRLNVKITDGNYHVDFFNDLDDPNYFHVYTIWKNKTALNNFLKSPVNLEFKSKLNEFGEKPYAAWTVENI